MSEKDVIVPVRTGLTTVVILILVISLAGMFSRVLF